tara:strand:- start:261 stop:734 length:474 start_codon:yes stop_codon:yes gene_type:complete
MDEFIKLQEQYDNANFHQSSSVGNYTLNDIQNQTKSIYPWAPTVRLQKTGNSMVEGKELIDVDSELMNITRKYSKDPTHHYKPDENLVMKYSHVNDGFFHQEDTRLNDPPELLRGQTKNRWINVYKDPQENIIEPFETRIGQNTYLDLMDNHEDCQQ